MPTLPYPQICYTTRGWLSNRSALFRGGGQGEVVTDEAVMDEAVMDGTIQKK